MGIFVNDPPVRTVDVKVDEAAVVVWEPILFEEPEHQLLALSRRVANEIIQNHAGAAQERIVFGEIQ